MATIQKSTKINFYKFVGVKSASVSSAANPETAELTNSINTNTQAVNNLGATLNSIAAIAASLKSIQLLELEAEKKSAPKFEPKYFTKQKSNIVGAIAGVAKGVGNMWEGLMNMLGGLLKAAIIIPAMEWLSNPENQKKVENILGAMAKIGKFIFDVAKFGVVNTIEGLYTLLSDESSPWEKIGGLVQGLTGLGTLMLGLRWLSNPTRLVTDFGNVLVFLYNNLVRGRRGLLGRAGALGLLAGAAYGGYKLYQSFNDDGSGGKPDPNDKPEGKSQGGSVKKTPKLANGGWISGPQSGYRVSLDGGRSTSFIGHGTEYVARKANGGAFVVPFNTPGTKTQPNLTSKRLHEAKSLGYNVPGMAVGGDYLKAVKANDITQGANDKKKIFLHWSAGNRDGTNFYKGHGYHTYIPASGQPVRRAKFGQTGIPHHTYGRDKRSSAAIGVAGMSTSSEENYKSWGSEAISSTQWKGMAKEAAAIATAWGWKSSDITDKRVRTHSEEYRDYPNWYHRNNGTHYRWDLNRLYAGDQKNTGGNKIRNMIKSEMGPTTAKDPSGVHGKDGSDARPQWNPLLGLADALTGNRFDFDGAGTGSSPPAPSSTSEPNKGGARAGTSVVERQGTRGSPFWTLAAVAGTEDGDPQGWADVAQSVYNRAKSGVYAGGEKDIRKLLLAKGQYEPTWKFPRPGRKNIPNKEWHSITDAQSAAHASGTSVAYMKRVAQALENKTLQKNAANFIGGRTDFMGGNERPRFDKGDVRRKKNMPNNFFGWFVGPGSIAYGKTNPSAAGVPDMTGVSTGTIATDNADGAGRRSDGSTVTERTNEQQVLPVSPMNILPAKRAGLADIGNSNAELVQQTEQRNEAQRTVKEKSSTLLNTAIDAIAQQNGMNASAIAAAKQAITQVMAKGSPSPKLMPTGGGGGSSTRKGSASSFNSMANTLRGLL